MPCDVNYDDGKPGIDASVEDMSDLSISPDSHLDALLNAPKLWSYGISPDRRWIAWTWWGVSATANVFAAPLDGSASPVQLTDTAQNTLFISWTPNSQAVIVAQDHDGDERNQLFRVELSLPGRLHALTEAQPNYFIRGGQLHPNEKWLIYGANLDPVTGEEIEPTYVYRHDLETGERRALARPAKGCYHRPALNRAGTHILYNRKDRDPSGYQLWMVDIEGQHDEEIVNVGDHLKVYGSWFPNSEQVMILAEADTHWRVGVWSLHYRELRWLIDDPSRHIESAYVPPGSEQAVILESVQARVRASLLDTHRGTETPLPAIAGDLLPVAPMDDDRWVGHYSSARHITDLVQFSQSRPATFKSLTGLASRTNLSTDDLVAAEDYRWKGVDQLDIQGWLYRTRQPSQGLIVCVHGGPTYHSSDAFDDQIQYLVSQGFDVLDPNYRGSTGLGRAFTEAIKAEGWGGLEQEDIHCGIEALIREGVAQRGKVGITGTSYGGYSSWHAITHFPSEIIAAAAPICGMTDLVVDYYSTRPDLRPYSEEMLGGTPETIPGKYAERSPINFVSQIKGRLLIIQGLRDPNVTPENLHQVKLALDNAGIAYETLTFADEGHGIDRTENKRILYQRLVAFFSTAFSQPAAHE